MRAYLKTFGCRVNQADSQRIADILSSSGIKIGKDYRKAEIIIVNSCVVTENAEKESLRELSKIKKNNPNSIIVLTGCLARLNKRTGEEIKGVKTLQPFDEKNVIHLLEKLKDGKDETYKPAEEINLRTRTLVKVQEGCDKFCSYCIVPYVRGKPRSRDLNNIVQDVKNLVRKGVVEVVLTGTHLGYFGKDTGIKNGLIILIERILNETEIKRIRLSSIDPDELSKNMIDLASSEKRICRHFHLPLQSGSERILKLMNRNCRPEEFVEKVREIHKLMPDANVGTDIIVGFPSEREEDFEKTISAITLSGVNYLHIFPFSLRKNTPAEKMKERVPQNLIKERCKTLKAMDNQLRINFHRYFEGKILEIVVEEINNNKIKGTTSNYLRVDVKEDNLGHIGKGQIVDIKIGKSKGRKVEGFAIRKSSH